MQRIASIDPVSHVSQGGSEDIDNDVAADIIDVSKLRSTLLLNGTGQTIAVVDTGLDSGMNSTLHQDFRGKVHRAYAYGRSGNWSDADIHVWDASTSSWE